MIKFNPRATSYLSSLEPAACGYIRVAVYVSVYKGLMKTE